MLSPSCNLFFLKLAYMIASDYGENMEELCEGCGLRLELILYKYGEKYEDILRTGILRFNYAPSPKRGMGGVQRCKLCLFTVYLPFIVYRVFS